MLTPTSQMRALRELEEPSVDEGFADVEHVPFERAHASRRGRPGVFVAARAVERAFDVDESAPHLVFDWSPDGRRDALADAVSRLSAKVPGPVEAAICEHPAGPTRCWCRPPLPGLVLAFTRRHGIDPSRSTVVGTGPAHRDPRDAE